MGFAKVFKIFKKGAKVAAKRKGKKPAEPVRWPGGTRIGIFGHANCGKTVFFTVLNEDCKISKKLQISVTDTATAGEFLSNYRSIWGLGTATDAGTVVDFRGERKFPDSSEGDKILKFNAIVDRKKKLSIVAYDYPGDAVSISSTDDISDKVIDFMAGCDGLLFFYDPKILGAELESQARVASYVNMLEILAPIRTRLPIPIGVVITKSDILPGYAEERGQLIGPEDEYLTSEDFDIFLERVLSSQKVASNTAWAGSVRNILVKLKDFLQVVLRRTLDFQMFFISCTGVQPEKIGTGVGHSIYAPPPKMQPVGVKEPFYWLLNSIVRNKRISRLRAVAKYATMLSILWIVVFSLPYLYHFKITYPKPAEVEQTIADAHNGSLLSVTREERSQIMRAYDKYERARVVKWFFGKFRGPARRIADSYREDNYQKAMLELKGYIGQLASIIANQSLWPQVKPTDPDVVITTPEQDKIIAGFHTYHDTGDSSSTLFAMSGRALEYWNLFLTGVKQPKDSATWEMIQSQVKQDSSLYWGELSPEERQLGKALTTVKVKTEKKRVAEQATVQLDDLMETINSNPSPEYRLDTAVDTLRKISGLVDSKSARKIRTYINKAREWQESRTYNYTLDKIPADWHLHIAVAPKGQEPEWKKEGIYLPGREEKITWKSGDVISIALDSTHSASNPETWGVRPRDKKVLSGDFSIFKMEGEIRFEDAQKSVIIRFTPELKDQLPELK